MLTASAAVILILGIAAGFWLIGVSLKDLRSLLATCNRIAGGNFTERARLKNQRKDEIGQLAESFNRMIDRLEEAFATQRRFVANAAHELLTPLTGLRGSMEVLLRGAQDDAATAAPSGSKARPAAAQRSFLRCPSASIPVLTSAPFSFRRLKPAYLLPSGI